MVTKQYMNKNHSIDNFINKVQLPIIVKAASGGGGKGMRVITDYDDINNAINSAKTDSFSNELLDYPHYTKPRTVEGLTVPGVLLEGHHEKIKLWRKNKSEVLTKQKRPDIWEKYNKSIKHMEFNHE